MNRVNKLWLGGSLNFVPKLRPKVRPIKRVNPLKPWTFSAIPAVLFPIIGPMIFVTRHSPLNVGRIYVVISAILFQNT